MPSLMAADLVVVLEPSVWVRDLRVLTRWFRRRLGLVREEPPKNPSLRWLLFMLRFSHRWSRETRTRFEQVARRAGKPVVVVKNIQELMDTIAGFHEAESHATRVSPLR